VSVLVKIKDEGSDLFEVKVLDFLHIRDLVEIAQMENSVGDSKHYLIYDAPEKVHAGARNKD